MDNLLTAIGNFITEHYFLTFLVLFFNPIRLFTINENKVVNKKDSKKEPKKRKKMFRPDLDILIDSLEAESRY